jgi:60 kDa SS-A/Ro ribonucleoprotein
MTAQMVPATGTTSAQERNYAGGYSFTVTDEVALMRLMTLGTSKGSYHASGAQLTKDQLGRLMTVLARDHDHANGGKWVVDLVVDALQRGRCHKRVYAMFIIANVILHGKPETVKYCRGQLHKMINIPTDLFAFIGFVDKWGSGQKRAIQDWFLTSRDGSPRSARSLAYLVFKYFQRDGWSIKDILRLCHLKPDKCAFGHQLVLRCAVKGWDETVKLLLEKADSLDSDGMDLESKTSDSLSERVSGLAVGKDFIQALHTLMAQGTDEYTDACEAAIFLAGVATAKALGDSADAVELAVALVSQHGIPREMLPTHLLNSKEVWKALLVSDKGEAPRLCMPATAMVRNLPTMTNKGIFSDEVATGLVNGALTSSAYLRKNRIHPIAMVAAKMTYASGRSLRGSQTWTPERSIVAALEDGIHKSFEAVDPIDSRLYLGVDVSPSMSSYKVEGLEMMCARDAAAIMALVFKKTATHVDVGMFSSGSGGSYSYGRSKSVSDVSGIVPCDLKASDTIASAMRKLSLGPWGGTDCSLPIRKALAEGKVYDAFVILTDNDTWAGPEHACESLRKYRAKVNPCAKLVVVAFSACTYSIADPADSGTLDMTGFDPSATTILHDFLTQDCATGADAAGIKACADDAGIKVCADA